MLDTQTIPFTPLQALQERMETRSCEHCSRPISSQQAVDNAGARGICNDDLRGNPIRELDQAWFDSFQNLA